MFSDNELYELLKTNTYAEVSRKTGIKPSTIQMRLYRHGFIKAKSQREKDRTCPVCGEKFGGDKRKVYCSHQCKDAVLRTYCDKRINKYNEIDKGIKLRKVYEKDDGICYICGCKTSFDDVLISKRGNKICGPSYPSIEHVIPLKLGGVHSWNNVRLACLRCNLVKGDRMREEVAQ